MNEVKPNSPLIILAVVGALLFILINWWPLFTGQEVQEQPHQMELTISKERAAEKAREFASAHHAAEATQKASVTYQSNVDLSGYLQKENIFAAYAEQYIHSYPLDFFQVELKDEATGTHYLYDVNSTDGNVFGWSQTPTSTEELSLQTKQQMAQQLMGTMGYAANRFTYSENTHDDFLTYISDDQQVGEAVLALQITVTGGEVIAFHPHFILPEQYVTWKKGQERSSATMGLISMCASIIMALTAVVLTIMYRASISFTRGIWLTLAFAVTYGINNINMYPGYKTISGGQLGSDTAAIFMVILMNLIVFLMAAALYLSLVSADSMWRREGYNLWPKWNQTSFGQHVLSGMGRGYLVCMFILGVQAVLFLIARYYFDVWSTSDPVSSPQNMLWPVLFPLLAWAAAISEEGIYRLFGIIIFKKLVRNSFLAVLLPSMIWALGHTSYPIYPVYTRFVEVTILGLIFGFVFLKYGFLTAVFAHATMDSILMGFSLMSLGTAIDVLSGFFYIGFPALIGYVIYWIHHRWHRNEAGPVHEAPQ